MRVYIPQSPDDPAADSQAASFKVVQSLVQPRVSERMFLFTPINVPYS